MKKLVGLRSLVLALVLLPIAAIAQVVEEPIAPNVVTEEQDPNEAMTLVEQMPEYPGGHASMMKFMMQELKYPDIAQENGIEGKVFISFVVERDGRLSNVQTLRSPHRSLEREAIRVVKSMPNWFPGMQKGEPCRVKYNLPVVFKLTD